MRPDDPDVRLALAWAELVALGGDPDRGATLVATIATDPELAVSAERLAMHHALEDDNSGNDHIFPTGRHRGKCAPLLARHLGEARAHVGDLLGHETRMMDRITVVSVETECDGGEVCALRAFAVSPRFQRWRHFGDSEADKTEQAIVRAEVSLGGVRALLDLLDVDLLLLLEVLGREPGLVGGSHVQS